MSYKITDIEGIGPVNAGKLAKANITTTAGLLRLCRDRGGRRAIASQTGLTESQLLKWVNMADLMRIKGVGEEFSELLEAAGVDTVKELRKRTASRLAAKMAEVNEERNLTRRLPAESMVERWIEQAKTLEPVITH